MDRPAVESSGTPWYHYSKWPSLLGGDRWTQGVLPVEVAQADCSQLDTEERGLAIQQPHLPSSGTE